MNICGWHLREESELQLDSAGICPEGLPASLTFIRGYQPQFQTRHWCCVCKKKLHEQNSVISGEMHGTETERAMARRHFPSQIVYCVFNCMTRGSTLSRRSAGFTCKWLHAALQPATGLLITETWAAPRGLVTDPTLLMVLLSIPHEMSVVLLENKHR